MTSDSTLIHDAELPADSTDAPDEWVELGRTAGAYGFKGMGAHCAARFRRGT